MYGIHKDLCTAFTNYKIQLFSCWYPDHKYFLDIVAVVLLTIGLYSLCINMFNKMLKNENKMFSLPTATF